MKNAETQSGTRVGIVGLGSVGSALKHALSWFVECTGHDLKGAHDWSAILATDVVFVCVDTPGGPDGRLDCSKVEDVLARLEADGFGGVVAVRSTVRAGFMDAVSTRHPHLRLVYMPEFLRERSRLQWSLNPDRLVYAGKPEDIEPVAACFEWVEGAEVIETDFASAEVGKLAHNAFIATKVSFTNEIERIASDLGAKPEVVMDIVAADRRVASKEHLRPFRGPYGGKCVPKDTSELIAAAHQPILLRAVNEVNEACKTPPLGAGDKGARQPSVAHPTSTEAGK